MIHVSLRQVREKGPEKDARAKEICVLTSTMRYLTAVPLETET